MAPEEAQQSGPRRRGRPPGSKNRRPGRRRAGGGDLVSQLNTMVAELIKKNRQLQRQVLKLRDADEVGEARDVLAEVEVAAPGDDGERRGESGILAGSRGRAVVAAGRRGAAAWARRVGVGEERPAAPAEDLGCHRIQFASFC